MARPTGPTNLELRKLITMLKKEKKCPDLTRALYMPRRKKTGVNLFDLEKAGETKMATTEVLGSGELSKPMTIYAWRFSGAAKQKIEKAGGKALSLYDLLKEKEKVKVVL